MGGVAHTVKDIRVIVWQQSSRMAAKLLNLNEFWSFS